MRQNFNQPSWSLVQPHCLPSSMQTSCDPQIFHSSSAYKLGIFPLWHRIIIPLTPVPYAKQVNSVLNVVRLRLVAHRPSILFFVVITSLTPTITFSVYGNFGGRRPKSVEEEKTNGQSRMCI